MSDEPATPDSRASRSEQRERLVAEVVALAESTDARYRTPLRSDARSRHWKVSAGLLILVAATLVAAFPPAWLKGEPELVPTSEELRRGLRAALHLQAAQVEVFRLREGRLPGSLDEVPVRIPGIRYVRSNNRVYQLVGMLPSETPIVYDSARPTEAFDSVAAGWVEAAG